MSQLFLSLHVRFKTVSNPLSRIGNRRAKNGSYIRGTEKLHRTYNILGYVKKNKMPLKAF
jgi:hypothetical protein